MSLSGNIDSDDTVILHEIEFSEIARKRRKTWTFRGKFTASREAFEGTWSSADGKKTLPFKLTKIAEYVFLNTEQGEEIRATTTYPYFLSTSPKLQQINKMLQNSMILQHNQFVRERQEEIYFSEYGSRAGYPVRSWTYDYRIVYYSEELISLFAEIESYTGGMHGNTYYKSANFWIKNGKATPLHLADLFVPHSAYIGVLSGYCIKELRNQEASRIVEGEITRFKEDDLRVFSLSPRGIRFTFEPYQVGSFVEGSYFVTVPYKALMNIMNSEGPLEKFIKGA